MHMFNYTTIYYLQLRIIMKTKKHIMKPITDKRTKEIFSLLKQAEQCVDDLENEIEDWQEIAENLWIERTATT